MSPSRVLAIPLWLVPVQWLVLDVGFHFLTLLLNYLQGISYMLLPFAFVLLQAVPRLKLWAAPIGFVIMCLALSLSSFATTTAHLIVSQGVAYGIGASLAYAPTIIFMDDWFVQRKGLAFGIMWVSKPHHNCLVYIYNSLIALLGRHWTIRRYSPYRPPMDAQRIRTPDHTAGLVSRTNPPGRSPTLLPSSSSPYFPDLAIPTLRLQVPLGHYVPHLRDGQYPRGNGLLPPHHLSSFLRPQLGR